MDITVKGKLGGSFHASSPATTVALDENDATVKTTLPQALTLGVLQKFGPDWNFLAEYVWTQYSRVEHVTVDGAVTGAGLAAIARPTTLATNAGDLEQQWKDQHQLKLAGEYVGMAMPIRFGYMFTSQVTNDDYARASFTAPGPAHTVTLGTGYKFSENLSLDGALDYNMVKGDGNGTAAGTGGSDKDIRAGEYETSAYALHLGLSYAF